MSTEMEAKALYDTLCQALDKMQWRYQKATENGKLVVKTAAVGDDLSMKLVISIDPERSVMYLKSPMPFSIPEDKRGIVAIGVIIANYAMLNGSFEYDMIEGYLAFKLVVPFMDSIISEAVCTYMVRVSCSMIDKFNDKLLALSEGKIDLDEFKAYTDKAFS